MEDQKVYPIVNIITYFIYSIYGTGDENVYIKKVWWSSNKRRYMEVDETQELDAIYERI